jgi:hypothetical protein
VFSCLWISSEFEETLSSILEISDMNQAKRLNDVYTHVDIAFRIFLCMPSSNCSTERSFSVLQRPGTTYV